MSNAIYYSMEQIAAYILESRSGHKGLVRGREVTIFSSNDYLGLSCHPEILKAASEAAVRYGTGTGGAPGTTGTTDLHLKLAESIASFKSREAALLFPSGYQANLALHQALADEDRIFYLDKRHHPSAADGVRLGKKAKLQRFDHNNLDHLAGMIETGRHNVNIVSLPSVFTVDGDIAPLDKLIELKNKLGFILIIDEAHATGCIGHSGRGLEEHFDLKGRADFIMGTFSKALGSQGGFLAYDKKSEPLLKSGFRAFEYSTSLSTVSAAAALKALELLENNKLIFESLNRAKKRIIDECVRNRVEIIARESMVMLIPCADPVELQARLLSDGFLVIPTEAFIDGQLNQCLRITPMALHSEDDITEFAAALKKNLD